MFCLRVKLPLVFLIHHEKDVFHIYRAKEHQKSFGDKSTGSKFGICAQVAGE